jgi:uncharacterized lipoprotein YajG
MNLMKNIAGSLLALVVLAGCAAPAAAPDPAPIVSYKPQVIDTGCNWTKVITVTDQRKFTDAAAKVIMDQTDADIKAAVLSPKQILMKAIMASNQDWLTPVTRREVAAHDDAWTDNCKK